MISSISHNAVLGLQRSQDNLVKVADEIASYPVKRSDADLNRSMIELRENEQASKANAKTLKAGDETIGSLLDVIA